MDVAALRGLRRERRFDDWDGFVDPGHIADSEASIDRLIVDLIALGPAPSEEAARRAVAACVGQFNDIDDGWIATIDREAICDQLVRIVGLSGFEYDDDWSAGRDW